MRRYDVIIIGAGIAGSSLAYMLARAGYKGSVCILECRTKMPACYGHRIVFPGTVRRYGLPVIKRYSRLAVGLNREIYFTLRKDFCLVPYRETCDRLLKRSGYVASHEEAVHSEGDCLRTDRSNYRFRYLIDCSGSSLFMRRLQQLPMPDLWWVARCSSVPIMPEWCRDDTFYFLYRRKDYFEDIYPLAGGATHGVWLYTNEPSKAFCPESTLIEEDSIPASAPRVLLPVAPVFPISSGNTAFLGDSFGNAMPSVGTGIQVTIESAAMLAHAILKGDLTLYEKSWCRAFLGKYMKIVSVKENTHFNSPLLESVKGLPDIGMLLSAARSDPMQFYDMIRGNERKEFTREFRGLFPRTFLLWQAYYYMKTYLKYSIQRMIF